MEIFEITLGKCYKQQQSPVSRFSHSCGILKDGSDYIVVVAGGLNANGPLASVEMYNLISGGAWQAGPDLAEPR